LILALPRGVAFIWPASSPACTLSSMRVPRPGAEDSWMVPPPWRRARACLQPEVSLAGELGAIGRKRKPGLVLHAQRALPASNDSAKSTPVPRRQCLARWWAFLEHRKSANALSGPTDRSRPGPGEAHFQAVPAGGELAWSLRAETRSKFPASSAGAAQLVHRIFGRAVQVGQLLRITRRSVARDSLEPGELARTSLPSIMLSRYRSGSRRCSAPPPPSWISRASRLRSSTTAISRTVRCSRLQVAVACPSRSFKYTISRPGCS